MLEKIISLCNYILLYSFYALFFVTPLTFSSSTYELFEFNKMWLVFALSILIGASWILKMILHGRILVQKTPLDIPILLFLASQIVSTIYSLDPHTSLWGYYSRFNGGLISIFSYIFLFYAFLSNYKDLNTLQSARESMVLQTKKHVVGYLFTGILIVVGIILAQLFQAQWLLFIGLLCSLFIASLIMHGGILKRIFTLSLVSAALVGLWGLPSHFGYDPTCYLFRGTLDVTCWTEAFQPKIRIFSTFGQPNWLAAYLAILLPMTIGLLIQNSKFNPFGKLRASVQNLTKEVAVPMILAILFYLSLIYTGSQSGFLGLWVGLLAFLIPFFKPKLFDIETSKTKPIHKTPLGQTIIGIFVGFLLIAFFIGHPIRQFGLDRFTFDSLRKEILNQVQNDKKVEPPAQAFAGELGGTDSGVIRKIVWQGAIDTWKAHPIIGSGVETFAYAYYQHRPSSHNLTSEWDYLYNKAHNEYLNYLATSGAFGFGSYMLMIGTFLFLSFKNLLHKDSGRSSFARMTSFWGAQATPESIKLIALGLLGGYVSILISNLLGFSVVVINIYFYLIPAFVLTLLGLIKTDNAYSFTLFEQNAKKVVSNMYYVLSFLRWFFVFFIILTTLYLILILYRFWVADSYFAKGYNLNRAGEYNSAYLELREAIVKRPSEPTFQDEYSYNTAVLATVLFSESESTAAAQLADESERISDHVTNAHPNTVTFWKTRVRVFYALSQIDESYLPKALEAIKHAASLAPTDAKVLYNLGILHGQNGDLDKAIEVLIETTKLKPNYGDAWYALGLYYREAAVDEKGLPAGRQGKVVKEDLQKKATETMEYIVKTFPGDPSQRATEALDAWGASSSLR